MSRAKPRGTVRWESARLRQASQACLLGPPPTGTLRSTPALELTCSSRRHCYADGAGSPDAAVGAAGAATLSVTYCLFAAGSADNERQITYLFEISAPLT